MWKLREYNLAVSRFSGSFSVVEVGKHSFMFLWFSDSFPVLDAPHGIIFLVFRLFFVCGPRRTELTILSSFLVFGFLDLWISGRLDLQFSVFLFSSLPVFCMSRPLDFWILAFVVFQFSGFPDLLTCGPLDLWFSGFPVFRFLGFPDLWTCGPLDF